MTVNVDRGQRRPGRRDKTVTTLEDTAYVFAASDFGFNDPSDTPTNSLRAVQITPCGRQVTADGHRQSRLAPSSRWPIVAADSSSRLPPTAAARLRQLHVPGPGRRRNGQRRHGP